MVLGNRAAENAVFTGGIAKTRMPFAARPFVHVVEEFAAEACSIWRRDKANDTTSADNLFKQAKA